MRFAVIGAGGYIAKKHLQAIKDTGNQVIAAVDISDSVGIMDSYFPNARFFTDIECFEGYLEKEKRNGTGADYISICTPNYLHDAHIRMALRLGAHAICEKPLVIDPCTLDYLSMLEGESGRKIFAIHQLRIGTLARMLKLKYKKGKHKVQVNYITRRGDWYKQSWKSDEAKSGGLAMNIGVHVFDLLIWIFGEVEYVRIAENTASSMTGTLDLERAHVTWHLSINEFFLPFSVTSKGGYAYRSISVDGEKYELSNGFTNLHTRMYEGILKGKGLRIKDARPAIELVEMIRRQHAIYSPRNVSCG